MKRREAVAATLAPLAVGVLSLPGCGDRGKSAKSQQVSLPPFSPIALHQKLDSLAHTYAAKSPKTIQYLQPGLSESQILERTAWFPRPLPPEVISLYQWRNGYSAPQDSDAIPFMFRDYTFLPLDAVSGEYKSMMETYGRNPEESDLLAAAFPFATLGGGWLVISASKQRLMPVLERPVISVFQGVSVFFYSVEKMVDTCTEWLSHPKHSGYALPPKIEMELWRKVNPGIFPN